MNYTILALLGVVTGGLAVLQGAVNARLSAALGSDVIAIFFNFFVGVLFMLALCVGTRVSIWPANPGGAPAWSWCGGILGALFVLATTFLIPRIGAANFVAVLVTGQILTAVLFDHFGLLGIPVHPVSSVRIVGCGLLLLAVLLIR